MDGPRAGSVATVGPLVHHSDRGSQSLAIRYTDRLLDPGITASAGTRGHAYDNALAETINGLYRAEVTHHLGLLKDWTT